MLQNLKLDSRIKKMEKAEPYFWNRKLKRLELKPTSNETLYWQHEVLLQPGKQMKGHRKSFLSCSLQNYVLF